MGRQREIAQARAALERHRTVTITGTGGVGKTRVAAEVARAVHREGHDEVAWVELAPVSDATALEYVVAMALGVDLAGGTPPREALLDALAARSLLLVVDNCEHLLDTVAPLVDEARRRCPRVRVLATSRERLAVDGEHVLPLAPLPTDAGGDDGAGGVAEAVALFLERAAGGTAGLDLSGQVPVVTDICRQLDGLPLAIELAAARAGALPLDALLAALEEGAPAAVGQRRSRPARHRDLWTVVDWSYRLLDSEQQRLFERLSVFAGAFAVDEAHAVCAPAAHPPAVTAGQLATLAEQSLLTAPQTGRDGASGRYRLLHPVRTFARQRLADRGEAGAVADRHAAALVAAAERAAGPPLTEEGRRWLEASLDDLRAARRRAHLTRDALLLSRLVAALYRFDYWRPGAELIGWADGALAMDGIDLLPAAPRVYAAAAAAAWMRGELERAVGLAGRATKLGAGPDDAGRTLAFEALADATFFQGRLDDAQAASREAVRLARLNGDPDSEVIAVVTIALGLAYTGRVAEAIAEADAADRAAVPAGPAARAFARYAQGECRAETAPLEALPLVEEAARLAGECEAWFVEGVARLTAASLRGRHGDPASAVPAYADLVRRWHRSGNWTQQWPTLRNLAELLVRLDADEQAVVIATAVEEAAPAPTFGKESDRVRAALATARDRLGPQRFEAARRQGQGLRGHELVEFALARLDGLAS